MSYTLGIMGGRKIAILLIIFAVLPVGCDRGTGTISGSGTDPEMEHTEPPCDDAYCDAAMWACKPGSDDTCAQAQTVMELLGDNTYVESNPLGPAASNLDCFYVYPTVANGPVGPVENFNNLDAILDPVRIQAAPFSQVCRVFAPLYHQVTTPTYQDPDLDLHLETAYLDVAAAFQHYLDHDDIGNDIALIGHSQGAHMLRRLVQRVFEGNSELLDRLKVGMLIGGDVTVAEGDIIGGSFTEIPLCTEAGERGCIVAYRSHARDYPPPLQLAGDGTVPACTNPAPLAAGLANQALTYFPTDSFLPFWNLGIGFPVDADFVLLRDFYSLECATTVDGYHYLKVSPTPAPGDLREDPIPYSHPVLNPSRLGLHVLDFAFTTAHLIRIVEGD